MLHNKCTAHHTNLTRFRRTNKQTNKAFHTILTWILLAKHCQVISTFLPNPIRIAGVEISICTLPYIYATWEVLISSQNVSFNRPIRMFSRIFFPQIARIFGQVCLPNLNLSIPWFRNNHKDKPNRFNIAHSLDITRALQIHQNILCPVLKRYQIWLNNLIKMKIQIRICHFL